VLRCIIANGMGNLHYCEGTIDMEAYVWILQRHAIREQRHAIRELPSRWHLSWEARQCQASFCTCYNWVVSRHSAPEGMCLPVYCSPDGKYMTHYEKENQAMMTTDCWVAVLYETRLCKNSTSKTPTIIITDLKSVIKGKVMWHSGNMSLSLLF